MVSYKDKVNGDDPAVCLMFGLQFLVIDLPETVSLIANMVKRNHRFQVVTPNMEYIYWRFREKELSNALDNADLLTPDGMPLVLLSRIPGQLRKPLPGRVAGADLLPALCEYAAQNNWRVMLLGGAPGVAEEAAITLMRRYPGLEPPRTLAPAMFFEQDPDKEKAVVAAINQYKPHLLAVAMGCPRQECWIHRILPRLEVNAIIGVGATLDFLAGRQQRAPKWMQQHGLEWCWRLVKSPRRLAKRYLWHYPQLFPIILREIFKGDRLI